MLKIAVCDDNSIELDRLSTLLSAYCKRNAGLRYHIFESATALLSSMYNTDYDILFLDIMMPDLDGMQAAHEIRKSNKDIKIIFLTSSPEFALESYSIKAFDYLLKPITKVQLYRVLDTLFADQQKPQEYFLVKTKTGFSRIEFSRLSFVEVINKQLYFHLTNGNTIAVNSSLSVFENTLLNRPEFIKIHRSYIVNLWQMSEITSKDFLSISGDCIPISRLLYPKVRVAFMNHLFIETEVES